MFRLATLLVVFFSISFGANAQNIDCSTQSTQSNKVLCDALGKLNGNWYSEKWKYGYELNNGIGVATSSNSAAFRVGDKIIRISPTSSNTFAGEQIYNDGKFYKITVTLEGDGRLTFNGEKNASWVMTRVTPQNSTNLITQTQNASIINSSATQSSSAVDSKNNSNSVQSNSANAGTPKSNKPSDANSYCEKVMSSEAAANVGKKYVATVEKLNELLALYGGNHNDPTYQKFANLANKAFLLGLDDSDRSKTKALVKLLNEKIPPKDAYNQDVVVVNYIEWFNTCAQKLKDSPIKFIFFNPINLSVVSDYYKSNRMPTSGTLQGIMGLPSMGRFGPETENAPASLGINPQWVSPMLFLADEGPLKVESTFAIERLDSIIVALGTQIESIKKERELFAKSQSSTASGADQQPPLNSSSPVPTSSRQPTAGSTTSPKSNSGEITSFSQYCERLTSNESAKTLVTNLAAAGKESIHLNHTYLDNSRKDLSKWVEINLVNAIKNDPDSIKEKYRWINLCLISQRKNNFFLLAYSQNDDYKNRDWYEPLLRSAEKEADSISKNGISRGGYMFNGISIGGPVQTLINTNSLAKKAGRSVETPDGVNVVLNYREATLLAFLFPEAEEIVKKTFPDAITAQQIIATNNEKEKAAKESEEIAKYQPYRRLIAFSKNKAISDGFQTCIKSETKFSQKLINQAENEIKNANTIQEQKNIKKKISNYETLMPVGIQGFCIYRLNIAMIVAEVGSNDLSVALPNSPLDAIPESKLFALGLLLKDTDDLNAKYTQNALNKINKHLEISPETYRKERNLPPDLDFSSPLILGEFVNPLLADKVRF